MRDSGGGIVLTAKVATDPEAIVACLADLDAPPERVILEMGRMSNWLHNSLLELGLPAICVDARQAHAVLSQMHNKTDFKRRGHARGAGPHRVLSTGRGEEPGGSATANPAAGSRILMIRQRLDVDNTIRGLLANLGLKLPKLRRRFPDRVAATVEDRPELRLIMQPLLHVRAGLVRALAELDHQLSRVVRTDAHCRRLMSVPGVGAVTAFAFVATVDDPTRFRSSRAIGAYLGLTPRRYQSGERDVSGRISKRGDRTMRTLLYEAAMSLMTRVRPAAGGPLQAWARSLRERIGHKKARVALARRIGVLMHRMWIDDMPFEHRRCCAVAA